MAAMVLRTVPRASNIVLSAAGILLLIPLICALRGLIPKQKRFNLTASGTCMNGEHTNGGCTCPAKPQGSKSSNERQLCPCPFLFFGTSNPTSGNCLSYYHI